MRKTVWITVVLLCAFGASAFAQEKSAVSSLQRVDPVAWNIRAGAGMAFDPGVFWLTAHAEAQLDKFFALGPTLQVGFGDVNTYTMASLGPRFTLPLSYFEWFVGASAGVSFRDRGNVTFQNFMIEVNTGFEFYVMKHFSLGMAIRNNWISSNTVDNIATATGYLSGHF